MRGRQGQGGGAKPKLTPAAVQQVQEELREKDFWSLPQVISLLQANYGVSYSSGHVRRLLHGWGMYHYKPQPLDYRRPADASQKLSDRLQAVADALKLWNCSSQELAFGFADESSPQVNSNTARQWSFYKKARAVNTDKEVRHNTFGFYAIQGRSVVRQISDSKVDTMLECLQHIRQANQQARYCVVIWDNFPSHCREQVQRVARELQIILVNLPPYAPDLNPIERIWKQIKREISYQGLIKDIQTLSNIIVESFQKLAQRKQLAQAWVEKLFIPIFGQSPIEL